jgi:hypothetical protein
VNGVEKCSLIFLPKLEGHAVLGDEVHERLRGVRHNV